MYKEIKFEVFHNKKHFGYEQINTYGEWECCVTELNHGNMTHWNQGVIFGSDLVRRQITGLKDKNNKDIYEGDILKEVEYYGQYIPEIGGRKEKEYFSVVEWGSEGWVHTMLQKTSCKSKGSGYGFYDNVFEVVGNIYENVDLLIKLI
jgi:uncharacterized phage protein (TIGR01671 family)